MKLFDKMKCTAIVLCLAVATAHAQDAPAPDAQTQSTPAPNAAAPAADTQTQLSNTPPPADQPASQVPPLEAQIKLRPSRTQTSQTSQIQAAQPQGQYNEATATADQVVGDWVLIAVPSSIQPKNIHVNPWPDQCQWFSFAGNGVVKSYEHQRTPCAEMTAQSLEGAISTLPVVATWRYTVRPGDQKAFVSIYSREMFYAEAWEPHVVLQDFSRDGADFKAGDLLLYLTDPKTSQIMWVRHLRRLAPQ